MKTTVEPFSAEYVLLPDVEKVTWPRSRVVVPRDLHSQLEARLHRPVMKLGSGHYSLRAENHVPSETVAVPDTIDFEPEPGVLVARRPVLPHIDVDAVEDDDGE